MYFFIPLYFFTERIACNIHSSAPSFFFFLSPFQLQVKPYPSDFSILVQRAPHHTWVLSHGIALFNSSSNVPMTLGLVKIYCSYKQCCVHILCFVCGFISRINSQKWDGWVKRGETFVMLTDSARLPPQVIPTGLLTCSIWICVSTASQWRPSGCTF